MIRKMYPYYEAEGGAVGGAGEEGKEPANDDKDAKKKTFDELLSENGDFRSELDRRIGKAVETATANERERQKIIQDGLQDEVLRVSKMTQTEKDAYFKSKAEKEQAKREADLLRRELTLDARTALAEKHLPDAFVGLLNYESKEACMKSIDTLYEAFGKAVQESVNDRLKGSKPPADAGTEGEKKKPDSEFEKALAEAMKIANVRTK